jgi:hypothetical protein
MDQYGGCPGGEGRAFVTVLQSSLLFFVGTVMECELQASHLLGGRSTLLSPAPRPFHFSLFFR